LLFFDWRNGESQHTTSGAFRAWQQRDSERQVALGGSLLAQRKAHHYLITCARRGMSAAFRVGSSLRGALGVSGRLLAVRLWNYFWKERFGESWSHYCTARRPTESPRILNFLQSTKTGISARSRPRPQSLLSPRSSLDLFPTVGVVKGRANAKVCSAQSTHFQWLGICREFTSCFRAGNCFGLEHRHVYNRTGPSRSQGILTVRKHGFSPRPSGRGAAGFFFSSIHAVAFQVAVQAGPPNPQKLRRP